MSNEKTSSMKTVTLNIECLIGELELSESDFRSFQKKVEETLLNAIRSAEMQTANSSMEISIGSLIKGVKTFRKESLYKETSEVLIDKKAHEILALLNGWAVGDIRRVLQWSENLIANSTTFKSHSDALA